MELLDHRHTLAEHGRDIAQNSKGVNNFSDFQKDVRSKIAFMSGVAWVITVLAPLALGLTIWIFSKFIIPAASLILEDYYKGHPNSQVDRKAVSDYEKLEYDARYRESHSQSEEIPTWQTDVKQ